MTTVKDVTQLAKSAIATSTVFTTDLMRKIALVKGNKETIISKAIPFPSHAEVNFL